MKTRILFLYRELAGYMVSCMNHLCSTRQVEADVVAYPVNPEAPFEFEFAPGVKICPRHELDEDSLQSMVRQRSYNLIFCGGWSDPAYLRLVKQFPDVCSVLAFDKQWHGSLRDYAAAIYLRSRIVRHFDYAFVPGLEQFRFARAMGFQANQVAEGLYCCDQGVFEAAYTRRLSAAASQGPRRIWFSGRYISAKCVEEMQREMAILLDQYLPEWELHCVGTGALFSQRLAHPRIIHHGFVQPEELGLLIDEGEINILPSRFEPWALSVHEFATAGYALIVSDRVGARTAFVEEGVNGLIFPSGNWPAFREAVLKLCKADRDQLRRMGSRSHALASCISQESWSESIMAMVQRQRVG
ncbi:MAG: glycosyltransferase family 4 protein [Flavobacteriales bacterium]